MPLSDLAKGLEPCRIPIDVDADEFENLREFVVSRAESDSLPAALTRCLEQYKAGPTLLDDGSGFEGCDCGGECNFESECCCIESHGLSFHPF